MKRSNTSKTCAILLATAVATCFGYACNDSDSKPTSPVVPTPEAGAGGTVVSGAGGATGTEPTGSGGASVVEDASTLTSDVSTTSTDAAAPDVSTADASGSTTTEGGAEGGPVTCAAGSYDNSVLAPFLTADGQLPTF